MVSHARLTANTNASRRTLVVFAVVAALWVAFDRITKHMADTVAPGTVLVDDIAGLFEFRLAHNTGAAWGIFGDSTVALGVFSFIVCLVILIYVIARRKSMHIAEVIPLALVFAGGLSNGIDRILLGYVVDFINCTFMSFPTFNVADIGVTCGIAVFLLVTIRGVHTPEDA